MASADVAQASPIALQDLRQDPTELSLIATSAPPGTTTVLDLLRDAEARRARLRSENATASDGHLEDASEEEPADLEPVIGSVEGQTPNDVANDIDFRRLLARGRRANRRRRQAKKRLMRVWRFFYGIYIYITSTISFVWGYRQYQALQTTPSQATGSENDSGVETSIVKRTSNYLSQTRRRLTQRVKNSQLGQTCRELARYVRDLIYAVAAGIFSVVTHPTVLYVHSR